MASSSTYDIKCEHAYSPADKCQRCLNGDIKMGRRVHDRKQKTIITLSCNDHNRLCAFVWCDYHASYEHAIYNDFVKGEKN